MKSTHYQLRITPETKAKGFAVAKAKNKSLAQVITDNLESAYSMLPKEQQMAIKSISKEVSDIVKIKKIKDMCLKKCNNSTTDYLSSIIDRHDELKSLVKEIEGIEDWKSIHALDTHETSEEEWGEKHNRLKQCQSRIFEIIKSL